ncbi:MAG: glycosyltransferase family 4 protein [Pseudomonadota bacterium]
MQVLLINDHGRAYGGAELQMLAVRDSLAARGHDVRLFSSNAEMIPGFPLLAERTCHGQTDLGQVVLQSANPMAWQALRAELRSNPPDVVHVRSFLWQLSPLILPLLRDLPVLHQAPTYKEICPNGLKLLPDRTNCTHVAGSVCRDSGCVSSRTYQMARLQMWLLKRWRSVLDVTTVLSRRAAERFTASGWTGVEVLPNPADARDATSDLATHPTLAYCGRLSREKGVDVLIDAFACARRKIPNAMLVIAGTGGEEEALRRRAKPLGKSVRFLGHVPYKTLDTVLAPAWVQAVPSIWHEPFGNVTLEAMMRGTAVLGANTGAISDVIVEAETGYIAPPGNVDAWATRLIQMLSDKALCQRLGTAGRQRALKDFGRDRHTDRLLELYAKAQQNCAARKRHAKARAEQKELLK